MIPVKRLDVPFIVLFMIFAALSTCCYGAECGFGPCPNTVPPCYRVTFTGHEACSCCEDAPLLNGSYILPWAGGCGWVDIIAGCYRTELLLTAGEANNLLYSHCSCWLHDGQKCLCLNRWICTNGGADANGFGGCSNSYICCPFYDGIGASAHNGSVTWEPIWDCNACGGELCDYNIPTYVYPENYDDVNYLCTNPDCCPVRTFAPYEITIYTTDPNVAFVVPDCNTSDPCIATVNSDPCTCAAGQSVTFKITPHQALPPAEAMVTCTASFYTATGDTVSKTVTITVKPEEHDCCGCSSGACGGGGGDGDGIGCSDGTCGEGGGDPPHPGSPPGSVIGFI